ELRRLCVRRRLGVRGRFGQYAGQLGLELLGLHWRQLLQGQLEQRVPEHLRLEQRQQLVSAQQFRQQLEYPRRFALLAYEAGVALAPASTPRQG
ncbi:MAG: hypothetical protein ACJ8G4_24375, partial [Burkholderiales bacterium]